jgi:hypothetical protein
MLPSAQVAWPVVQIERTGMVDNETELLTRGAMDNFVVAKKIS